MTEEEQKEARVRAFAAFVAYGGLDLAERIAQLEERQGEIEVFIRQTQAQLAILTQITQAITWCETHPCLVNFGADTREPGRGQVTLFALPTPGERVGRRLGDGASFLRAVTQARAQWETR